VRDHGHVECAMLRNSRPQMMGALCRLMVRSQLAEDWARDAAMMSPPIFNPEYAFATRPDVEGSGRDRHESSTR